MKVKDITLNNLKVILQSVPREKLYSENSTAVQNKWQALTARSKIVLLIKEVNKAFEKRIENADKLLGKFRDEHKLLEVTFQPAEDKKDEKLDDKKRRLEEKSKVEKEINERFDEQVKKDTGLKLVWYGTGNGQVVLPHYVDEKDEQVVEVEFDEEHKQIQFIAEQIEHNLFQLPVDDLILSELHELFCK